MRRDHKESMSDLWELEHEAFVAYNTEVTKTIGLLALLPERMAWKKLERQHARERQAFLRYQDACKSLQAAILHDEKIAA